MVITNCKVNHIKNPLGYHITSPVFSYTVEGAQGKHQLGARIQVALDPEMKEIAADTGWDNLNSTGTRLEMDLKPRTRYYWTVTAGSDAEEEVVSQVNWFETAKQEEAWEASWITDTPQNIGSRYPVFHKHFTLRKAEENADRNQNQMPVHSLFTYFGRKDNEVSDSNTFGDARLYITGLGLYHVLLNGKEVTEEKLTPYCNDYDEWIQYQTYDVSDLLQEENDIDITLAPGWYAGRYGFTSQPGDPGFYGSRLMTIAELRIRRPDGSENVIGTDDSWTVTRSHITFSGIYDGEHVDDTLPETEAESVMICRAETISAATGSAEPSADPAIASADPAIVSADSAILSADPAIASAEPAIPSAIAPAAPLIARMSVPVLPQETIPASALLTTPAGEQVFDLGQNIAGGFRLLVSVQKGTVVTVQFGEVLQNGCFYRDNLRTAKAEYVYVSDGEPHVLEPVFTYYGYRYAKVTGIGNLKQEHFCGVAYYSDTTPAGILTTGNAKVNQLISNIRWSQKSNFIDVPTDCPQRDERMGWTGDTQVFAGTACYFTDAAAFYRKFLYDLRKEQEKLGGQVPFTVPSFGIDQTCSVWGDCAVLLPWTLYTYTGDLSILEESFDSMRAWVDYITLADGGQISRKDDTDSGNTTCTAGGWGRVFHFGDWLALDAVGAKEDTVQGATDAAYIAYTYYMNSAEIVAQAATLRAANLFDNTDEGALNRMKEFWDLAEYYKNLAAQIRQNIMEEYFTPSGRCAVTTQTGYVLALKFGLTADPGKTLNALLADIKARGNKLSTGFVGTPLLLRTLSENGCDREAYDLLLNEEYPGWLYEVNLGATTIWERWNSMNPDGSVSSTGMNSFNHYAYGSVGEWMWQTIAGIIPSTDGPGFKQAVIRPVPDPRLGWARAEYASAAGTYRVEWKLLSNDRLYVKAEIPFDCSALLLLPFAPENEASRELEAGVFETTYTMQF